MSQNVKAAQRRMNRSGSSVTYTFVGNPMRVLRTQVRVAAVKVA